MFHPRLNELPAWLVGVSGQKDSWTTWDGYLSDTANFQLLTKLMRVFDDTITYTFFIPNGFLYLTSINLRSPWIPPPPRFAFVTLDPCNSSPFWNSRRRIFHSAFSAVVVMRRTWRLCIYRNLWRNELIWGLNIASCNHVHVLQSCSLSAWLFISFLAGIPTQSYQIEFPSHNVWTHSDGNLRRFDVVAVRLCRTRTRARRKQLYHSGLYCSKNSKHTKLRVQWDVSFVDDVPRPLPVNWIQI